MWDFCVEVAQAAFVIWSVVSRMYFLVILDVFFDWTNHFETHLPQPAPRSLAECHLQDLITGTWHASVLATLEGSQSFRWLKAWAWLGLRIRGRPGSIVGDVIHEITGWLTAILVFGNHPIPSFPSQP